MKFVIATVIALASTVAMAGQEDYPTPMPTGVYGTSTYRGGVQAQTGSEATPQQPLQTTVFRAANCVNGVDRNTGEALVVCRNGANN